MNDLISLIIPVYNTEQFLRRCLDSVINQTYKNLEIILIDDGSTDNSGKICDEYVLKDNRIKVLHIENGGPSYARNKGLEIAKGDYIGFVDSDDYVDKDIFNLMRIEPHTINVIDNQIQRCLVTCIKHNQSIAGIHKMDRRRNRTNIIKISENLKRRERVRPRFDIPHIKNSFLRQQTN